VKRVDFVCILTFLSVFCLRSHVYSYMNAEVCDEISLRTNTVILVNVKILVDIFHYTPLRTDTGNMKSVDIHNMKCVA